MAYPALPSSIGKRRHFKDIDGKPQSFVVRDEIVRIQSDNPGKAIYLQYLDFDEPKRSELRLGYYMIAKRPRMAGKWAWGQSAAMLPIADFEAIVREAKKRGWL